MERQVILRGIAGDPSRPLVWGYRQEGPRVVSRRGTPISDDSDGRKSSPVSKGAK